MLIFLRISDFNMLVFLEILFIFYETSLKETPWNGCFSSHIASVNNETFDLCFFFLVALILRITDVKQYQAKCNMQN